ncbi:hypothetical protein BGW41_006368 [Actinomortierella wolfii]|nr:hypothetical protein BGW41_006368 [Actinomortierella wolfii]
MTKFEATEMEAEQPVQLTSHPADSNNAPSKSSEDLNDHRRAEAPSPTPSPSPKEDAHVEPPPLVARPKLSLPSNRLLSLDLLRGLAILLMITCNSQTGDVIFKILEHPAWIGFSVADSIFPAFLFISGVAIPLAIRLPSKFDKSYDPQTIDRIYLMNAVRIFKRSFIIWALGAILNLYGVVLRRVNISMYRWPGVLQRIGFCYGIVAWMHLLVHRYGRPVTVKRNYSLSAASAREVAQQRADERATAAKNPRRELPLVLQYTLPYWLPIFCTVFWLIVTYTVRVTDDPKCIGVGYLDERECGAQAYFDTRIFGKDHMYQNLAFDPEGALSTLTSILNVWFGWFIGCTVRKLNSTVRSLHAEFKARRTANDNKQDGVSGGVLATGVSTVSFEELEIQENEILVRIYSDHLNLWFWYGILWLFIGWVFSLVIPLSKPAWTVTFAVLTCGLSTMTLAVLFYKFDYYPKYKHLEELNRINSDRWLQVTEHDPQLQSLSSSSTHDPEQQLADTRNDRPPHSSSSILNYGYRFNQLLRRLWRQFIVLVLGSMGRNAILMYYLSEFILGTGYFIEIGDSNFWMVVFDRTWGYLEIGGWGSLFFALGYAAFLCLIAIFLDWRKWYFRV